MISVGGQRIYVAGVTECVVEVRAPCDINVALLPMNIPLERMTPASAECTNALHPKATRRASLLRDLRVFVSSCLRVFVIFVVAFC